MRYSLGYNVNRRIGKQRTLVETNHPSKVIDRYFIQDISFFQPSCSNGKVPKTNVIPYKTLKYDNLTSLAEMCLNMIELGS